MFETFELARFLGRPVQLFEFTRQTATWRFCTADRDLQIAENLWLSAPIERSAIKQTAERAKDKLTITVAYLRDPTAPLESLPATQSLGDNWYPYVPSSTVSVTCLSAHVGDDDPPAIEWLGRVTQPAFTDVRLELTCEPTGSLGRARNQGARWQRGCWKTVYSTGLAGCNLDPAALTLAGTLEAVDGLTLTSDAFAAAPINLAGGAIAWTSAAGLIERRSIMEHSGATVTVLYAASDLLPGLEFTATPGCSRTWTACAERDNTINYGGAIYKPVKDPTAGSMSWG
jgi:hypothetical protein